MIAGSGRRRSRLGAGVPLAVTAAAFLVGYVQKLPCHVAGWPWKRELIFGRYCYSDIPTLFQSRGLGLGLFPYSPQALEHPLEYPVVTGLVVDWTARVSGWLAPNDPRTYFEVNTLLLLACALATTAGLWALLRRMGARESDALLFAAAPTLALAGTINWDLVAVALSVLALAAWAYRRPWLAGALIGLGAAAKLYPAFILGPLLLVCLRERRMIEFTRATLAAVAAWLAINLPIMVLYPAGWKVFWQFNADRPADFGSLWYALGLQGHEVPHVNAVAVLTMVALLAGVAALARYAPEPPGLAQLTLLTVAAFLLTNKVYSPQYVLWLLPFVVLARGHVPLGSVVRDWAIWQASEVVYWLLVWKYLAWTLGDAGWLYPAATYLRVAATVYLCVRVVRDVLAGQTASSLRQVEPSMEKAV